MGDLIVFAVFAQASGDSLYTYSNFNDFGSAFVRRSGSNWGRAAAPPTLLPRAPWFDLG